MGDPDAKFSRFNYIDPVWYYSHLLTDKRELEQELRILSDSCVEAVFLSMSLEMVLKCLHQASDELKEEQALQERFTNPISGMYQLQSLNETPKGCAGSQSSFEQTTMVPDESTSFHGSLVTSSEANDRPILMQNASRSPDTRRFRGDSIDSSSSTSRREDETSSPKSKKNAGSIYLDDSEAVHFYQAEDGQLVFLNGFNMACLLSDFSRTGPTKEDSELRPPFPDCIEGNILELQHVHLTPEVQKRMPFLSHLQLYLDLVFVELDLNNVLTSETKFKFRAELTKRKKRRQSRVHAEKRVDRAAKKEEAQRINDRKARLQVVDLEDDFFHAVVQPEPVFHGENFGPSVGGSNQAITSIDTGRRAPVSSFSEACQRSNNTLLASSSEAFPALEASHQSNISPANEHWGNRLSLESDNHIVSNHRTDRQNGPTGKKKKKGKGQKLLLFSTGGQRGSIY